MALRYPLDSVTFTQGFGANPDYYKQFGQSGHNGYDLRAAAGTPVYAADDGVVAFEGWGQNHSWMGKIAGICVILKHSGVHTGYAHLTRTIVSKGQSVRKGDVIGYSGATGTASGPHLHFEVLPLAPNFKNGYAGRINPVPFINTTVTATADQIKQAYQDILERPADADGIRHYQQYSIEFVRQDLSNSQEKRDLEARKAQAARDAAAQAQAEAARKAEEATKAAAAQKSLEEAKKAEEARLAAEAELARIAAEEKKAREEAEARAKAQAEIEAKAKEDAMTTLAETVDQVEETAKAVADSDIVKDLVAGVSKRTKLVVYFVGDTLLGLALIAPQVIALLHATDPTMQGALVAGILSTAGGFLLTMFGIYKANAK